MKKSINLRADRVRNNSRALLLWAKDARVIILPMLLVFGGAGLAASHFTKDGRIVGSLLMFPFFPLLETWNKQKDSYRRQIIKQRSKKR